MTRWRPYLEYKDSGLPRLAEVPTHWDIRKLKHISSVTLSNVDKQKNEGERSVHLCNYVDVYYNDCITADLEFMEATASPEEVKKFALKGGDVIITKDSESWDDIAVAAYVPSDLEGVLCGYHLALVRPNQRIIDGKYLFQSFCTSQINEQFTVEATGITRYGLAKHWIDNASFLVPPLPEQHAIAAFLDHHTAKIDALIAEQRHLIELLQEHRAALISHAVSKGLDPGTPMKDSGIPWLGEIPEYWKVIPLKYLTPQITVGIVVTPSKYYVDEGIPCLRSLNVKEGFLTQDDLVFISPESNDHLRKSMIFAGDLVSVRSGQPGTTAVVDEWFDGANCIDLIITRQSRHFDSYLMADFLNSYVAKYQFGLGSGGAIQQHFNIEAAKNLLVLVPPLDEQHQIAAHLDRETAKIDALIAEIETGIAHLKEYRTTLISAAVTGKIDVRDSLPSDAPAQPRSTGP
jgi:type I restriction enzyme S subunit